MARTAARPGLILLDRDGVLNQMVVHPEHGTVDSPLYPSEVVPIESAIRAAACLSQAGWTLAICSNQPAAAKGKTTRANLESVHRVVLDALCTAGAELAGSYLCFHRAEDGCDCRKPKPGLLCAAVRDHGHPGADVWMVGDGVRDMEAGRAAGTRTAFVGGSRCDSCQLLRAVDLPVDFRGDDLAAFAQWLLAGNTERSFAQRFLDESVAILRAINPAQLEALVNELEALRERGGRLFVLGVGGSAGHASHAVNDFRKLCGIEAYAPTDNVSELTARINDEGWESCFAAWLQVSRLRKEDALLIFSVGGGSRERGISVNLIAAAELARERGARVLGIVGRDGGYTARIGDAVVLIPPLSAERVTPHTEGLAAVVWHLLVSHPRLQRTATKWEGAR